MGVKEIQPFMKCKRIFYLVKKLGIASLVLSLASMP